MSLKKFTTVIGDFRPTGKCDLPELALGTGCNLTRLPSATRHLAQSCKEFLLNSVLVNLNVFLLAVLFCLLSSLVSPSEARRSAVCNGIPCANGGKLQHYSLIYGICRCKCPKCFVGPYCQYRALAKAEDIKKTTDDARREMEELLKQIKQRLLRMSQRLREEMEVDDFDDLADEVDEDTTVSPRSETTESLDGGEESIPKQKRTLLSVLSSMS